MNNKNEFQYFDTTADIGIKVKSKNIEEAFENSALATLNLVTDIEKIEQKTLKNITLTSEDEYGLLYDWITELLLLLDSENFIASRYNIKITQDENSFTLNSQIIGDTYDTSKYNYKTEVKAITYHEMNIEIHENSVEIKFIVDL